ncbi:penicillin-binding transpeptidase domain-containing protein [Porphyromonas sp. COT-239 OH1446]|uniref:penicillin-binding transpeptidase domain-containing protein n=1 Tax=Porphyromonas sp. COT-239 OH1446 TaxID=1515613 RepID=UPI00052C1285|nr:penicillin-binding transpeptidase domain-containing protein [Porphyromonas sp. COT-239 OH1446]KGN71685.1 penicillin-binding protein [Porphyromonas sp. COT-239 OH1446]
MPNDKYYQRRWLMIVLVVGIVTIYILRLFQLQIIETGYKQRADNNAYYIKSTYPSRGVIYDRGGRLLVENRLTYDLMITMHEAKHTLDTLALSSVLSLPIEQIRERLEAVKDRRRNRGYTPYTPQVLLSQLDEEDVGRFQELLYKFPGFSVQKRTIRHYNYQNGAHLLGYLAEASPKDIERDSLIAPGDYVGKSGVERFYDVVLRGEKGEEILLRDSRGRIKGRFNDGMDDRAPINGRDLTLSIDGELQAFGEELMRGKRGAIVAIEPETGEILALVTAPSYNPARLAGKDKGVQHKLLEVEAGKPLFNRAIMGTYPPGSTFKTAQAAIFLAEGVVTPQTPMSCIGGYPRLRGRPKCHPHAPSPTLAYSLSTSCNSYYCWGMHYLLDNRSFYPTIQEAFEAWKHRIVSLGYGYRLGVDLSGEKPGYIPNSKVYDKVYRGNWSSSTIISISIGQGEILSTPLQIANLAAIVANRGTYRRPHVVRSIDGMPLDSAYTNIQQTSIAREHWEQVVQGMAMAVSSGTCRGANFAPGEIEVCGKTGTAENNGKDHSAFMGFAPRHKPRIAVAVYVEHGGYGAAYGVPIGRLMMEHYLRKGSLSSESEALYQYMRNSSISYYNDI